VRFGARGIFWVVVVGGLLVALLAAYRFWPVFTFDDGPFFSEPFVGSIDSLPVNSSVQLDRLDRYTYSLEARDLGTEPPAGISSPVAFRRDSVATLSMSRGHAGQAPISSGRSAHLVGWVGDSHRSRVSRGGCSLSGAARWIQELLSQLVVDRPPGRRSRALEAHS
jgi:hypothetical protein